MKHLGITGGWEGGASGRRSSLLSLPGDGAYFCIWLQSGSNGTSGRGGDKTFSGEGVPMQTGATIALPGGARPGIGRAEEGKLPPGAA